MPQHPGVTAQQKDPRQEGADLVQALAQLLAHNSRFLDDVHAGRPLFFRGTVTALQTTSGVRQVQVQRAGQVQADGYWYPIYDAGYAASVGDDVLLVYTDRRMSACVIGARTMTSPAASGLSTIAGTSAAGESYLTLTVTNNATTSIGGSTLTPVLASGTDYVVQCRLSGSTATQVWNALSDQTNRTDLKVVFQGTEIDADLDTVTNGAWSSSNQTLWFRLQRPVAAGGTDQGYQLRLGGGLRSSPPRSWANIYNLSDDFPGSGLDGTKWSGGNATVSVAGSVATVSASSGSQYLRTTGTWGASYVATMYGTLPTEAAQFCTFGWNSAPATFPLADVASTVSNPWRVREYKADGSAFQSAALGGPDNGSHVFWVARDASGAAYGAAAGTTGGPLATYATTGAYPLAVSVNLTSTANPTLDWVKVRPYVYPEPTVTVGSGGLQRAGGLRWEPVCDSGGSVLITGTGDPVMALSPLS